MRVHTRVHVCYGVSASGSVLGDARACRTASAQRTSRVSAVPLRGAATLSLCTCAGRSAGAPCRGEAARSSPSAGEGLGRGQKVRLPRSSHPAPEGSVEATCSQPGARPSRHVSRDRRGRSRGSRCCASAPGRRALPWVSRSYSMTGLSFAVQIPGGNIAVLCTTKRGVPRAHARRALGPVPDGAESCSQGPGRAGRQRWDSCLCRVRTWWRRNSRGGHAGCICRAELLPEDRGQWGARAAGRSGHRGWLHSSCWKSGSVQRASQIQQPSSYGRRWSSPWPC